MLKHLYRNVKLADSAYSHIKRLPAQAVKLAVSAVIHGENRKLAARSYPPHLVYFVTNRCNQKCAHCFYIDEINTGKDQELSLSETETIARSMDGILDQLVITGGEPFLRKDLPSICEIFEKHTGVKSIALLTNGGLPDRVLQMTSQILDRTSVTLSLQVSIDGPELFHDKNRGAAGRFKRAQQTIDGLVRLRSTPRGKRIARVHTATAISRASLSFLEATLDELRSMPRQVFHGFTFVRGTSTIVDTTRVDTALMNDFDPQNASSLTPDEMRQAFEIVDRQLWSHVEDNLYYASNRQTLRLIEQFLRNDFSGVRCLAGNMDAVLFPNGDIGVCELLHPFANLRDHGLNFKQLWDARYPAFRQKVSACRCAHDCNTMSMIKTDKTLAFEMFKD